MKDLEYVRCNLCGSNNYHLIYLGKDRLLGKKGEFRIVKCNRCGLVYLNPRPTKEKLTYYYSSDDYYLYRKSHHIFCTLQALG
ncbi:hypothetical protein ES703_68525 [subsurface metagenome]